MEILLIKRDKDNGAFVLVGINLLGTVIGIGVMQGVYKYSGSIGIITYNL